MKKQRDWLFVGTGHIDPDMNVLHSFLFGKPPGKKTPADAEVRGAVARLLRCDQDALGTGRKLVALLFDPERPSGSWRTQHKVFFKQTSTKNTDIQRNITIAWEVRNAYEKLGSYDKAVAEVAENRDLSERQVKRIYAPYKDS
jgi:hypothetical protein